MAMENINKLIRLFGTRMTTIWTKIKPFKKANLVLGLKIYFLLHSPMGRVALESYFKGVDKSEELKGMKGQGVVSEKKVKYVLITLH